MRSAERNAGTRWKRLRWSLIAFVAVGWMALAGGQSPGAVVAQQGAAPTATPLPLYALPNPERNPVYTSNTMALTRDGLTMAAANMLNDSLTLLRPLSGTILAEVPVGADPRGVAITPDGNLALTANRGDETLSVVHIPGAAVRATIRLGGAAPYAVVAGSNETAYVSLLNSDEIVRVDLRTGSVTARMPVADAPAGLALWGEFLYVTHFWSGMVTQIYLPQARTIMEIPTGQDSGLAQAMEIDGSRGVAFLPQTRLNAQNENLTYDTIAFPVVNRLDLRDLSLRRTQRLTLDTADRPVNMPFAVDLNRQGTVLYVANAGSNDVTVLDLATGRARGHVEVGANPRGILLSADGRLLFVHNVLDSTITIIDTDTLAVLDNLPISTPTVSTDLYIGARLFHSADDPQMAADGWVSCATCHFDGQSDGRTWRGFPGGPRNTPLLYELPETAPYTWTNSWDELADVEVKIRGLMAGQGLIEGNVHPALDAPNAGVSPDLDSLVTYLVSIPNPGPMEPEPGTEFIIERGREVFAERACDTCHVGPAGTDLQLYDVGTARSSLEQTALFNTPSLRWLKLSAPYFHDGAAATLPDVFALPGSHQLIYEVSPEDIDALVTYLLAWPSRRVPAPEMITVP